MAPFAYTVNETLRLLLWYATERGLTTDYLTDNRDAIEDGLWTWLAGRHLSTLRLEVFDDATGNVVERVDLSFPDCSPAEENEETVGDGTTAPFEALEKELLNQVQDAGTLPETTRLRLVAVLDPDEEDRPPPPVASWTVDHVDSRTWQVSLDNHRTTTNGDQ